MQILEPSGAQCMSLTTLSCRLLIISSCHCPLCRTHTMMRPLSSEVVSFLSISFQQHAITVAADSMWPSKEKFDINETPAQQSMESQQNKIACIKRFDDPKRNSHVSGRCMYFRVTNPTYRLYLTHYECDSMNRIPLNWNLV